ncbi:fumarylacetoacetate hydrolase family protein [Alicyclobacillus fastidiosus]|uniref:Fumarylacetoacetate hydrolase family protein n=1 Tax=Alicyclobacillus fastidiosus TaxID=392011 RepID=A0ABY6ZE95_9BACL|nr:fumarylacetoacetate hydrolase family protein [Alicyclobacillus fastidiosus]WAH41176.1 fumarylacetoacetate hydrolase family protein [Alicyclobacillus fastidiosus]GMA62751.1 2-hydroxyhepta-2,4-diene-1,7-dioate isomerase [Alicyclobacillus fastidiosus]
MKIALFDDNRLGIVKGDGIVDVSELVQWNPKTPQASLVSFMSQYEKWRPAIERALSSAPPTPLQQVTLRPPVPNPSKIVAAPVNYYLHQDEMNAQFQNAEFTVEKLGFFLKASSSIIGPNDTVLLPYRDRRFDHEAELAFVVGKQAKDVRYAEAADYIFGYFALMDMTMRGKEDRPMRKSFDTFTPVGPWIVTKDEIEDPNQLSFTLWVNQEVRQQANTRDLIYDCYKFFEVASHVMTLEPGDIVTTGTPEGVGPVQPGDTVRIQIERIGEFSVSVDYRPGV